jgi:hypothetical protein
MKIVNALFLDYLTAPLNGGADDDEMVTFYFNVEVNDQEVMKNFIKEIIKPYVEKYSEAFLMRMKESLSYHLSNNKIDFERLFNSNLLPFDHPREARQCLDDEDRPRSCFLVFGRCIFRRVCRTYPAYRYL